MSTERRPAGVPWLRARDLTAMEVKDALWLAGIIRAHTEATPLDVPPDDPVSPTVDPTVLDPPDRTKPSQPQPDPDLGVSWSTRFARSGDGAPPRATAQIGSPSRELPHSAQLARALRPLMKRSPSPWKRVVNEEATAVRAAQDGMWLPVLDPAPWRRFEVVLVVDTAASMEVWRETVAEFRELLRQQGAFRNVRTLLVDCSTSDLVLRVEGPAGAVHSTRHLVDPTGRRLVLVMTDAIANAWRDGSAEQVLAGWANRMPLAIINVLPSRLWSWGGLSPRRVSLSSGALGVANRELRVRWIEHDMFDEEVADDSIPVPVLALTPEWLSGWANLFAASGAASVDTTAVMVNTRDSKKSVEPSDSERTRSAFDRVMRFRTYASLEAFHLAGLLAAAPLNLAMMRFVQRELLPDSDVSALAEVILGGLLRKVRTTRSVHDPTAVVFEFHDGVREELLSGVRRADTVRVARVLGDYLGSSVAILRNFRDAVDDPDGTVQPEISAETMPYLRVQEAVFRALSGRYAPRAASLRRELQHAGQDARLWTHRREEPPLHDFDPAVLATEAQPEPSSDGLERRPQVWGSVPVRNPDFVGRDDLLWILASRLDSPGVTAVLPEALQGMGGVGKSQTVVEYIYRHTDDYDVIWWIPAEQMSQITASFVELAKRLGLPASSAEVAITEVLESLRLGRPFSRWLLVFDNAGSPDSVRPFFPSGPGHIIVTSRDTDWAREANVVEVDLFTRRESIEMLRRVGGDISQADADRVADALGDLPLAVEQAAVWRMRSGMPAGEYLRLLEANLAELPDDVDGYGMMRPVAAAWSVPLSRLRTDFPEALRLLQACAYLGPEPIPQSFFSAAADVLVPDELAGVMTDQYTLGRIVREISRYGLAKVDERHNTLQLHRLVQEVIKNQLPAEEKDQVKHVAHVLLVINDPDDPVSSRTWARYSALLPHAIMSDALRCRMDPRVRHLVINLVTYLVQSGDYRVAHDLACQAIDEWQQELLESDASTLEMARLRGLALWRLGRYEEAYDLNRETFQIVRRHFGNDNKLFLSVANTFRMSMRAQGRIEEELAMQRTIFKKSCHVLGRNDPETLQYANDLGGSLRLIGQFFEARELDTDTWRRKVVVLGEDHPDTFLTLNALAMDMRECGEHIEACRIQEQNLARQRLVIGDEHPRTIGAMRNLAVARRRAGLYRQAADLSTQCFEMYRRLHGARHVDTITAQMCMSADFRKLDELHQSQNLGTTSYQLFVETHGEWHPFTLVAAINLAVTLRLLGHVDEAMTHDEATLGRLREMFGDDHPFTLVTATNLASDLAASGRLTEAYELDRDTFERSTRVLGAEHPSTLAVGLNLSIDSAGLGEPQQARVQHASTVNALSKVLGSTHPATMAAMNSTRADCDTDTMQL
ncbi:FxSxx-COOH system tetratricopeptide repeat protein [Kibdelosporangium persicum]|uniref:Cytochrome C n=1 Tax=Kibdelosporangium persicum TaxID=2698649 RepID=A0ABX2EWS0_9PSEU|nr:FxSxx-COOH system tetratricopeptide repeat protein [Kibdelosporangium persicum]NRN63432.1 Cytochrome C [Kibdelosporangium persicum]